MNFNDEHVSILSGLKSNFPNVHPLAFQRSCEYAQSPGELFDILSSIDGNSPYRWNNELRRWVSVTDITLSQN